MPVFVAVEVDLWEWNSSGLTVSKGEPLIKIWAMLERVNTRSPVWIVIFLLKLLHGISSVAVISNLWVWHTSGLTIGKGESLIEVWAVLKSSEWLSPVWILLLNKSFLFLKLIVCVAVEANIWIWNSLSSSISKSESFIEVGAVFEGLDLIRESWSCWVSFNLGVVLKELDEGIGTDLGFAGSADVGELGNMSLSIIHNSSTSIRRAIWESILFPWGLR